MPARDAQPIAAALRLGSLLVFCALHAVAAYFAAAMPLVIRSVASVMPILLASLVISALLNTLRCRREA